MADQVLKLQELEDFIYDITCKMLDIDLNKEENQDRVRIAWPTDGSPAWSIDEDVVYLRITPIDDSMARQQNIAYNPDKDNKAYAKKQTGYTRVHKINWTLYGPNSYDNADIIRHLIFDYDYMKKFKEKNIFLITDVPMPTRLPELYNGQWWERTDFSATFNEAVIRENKVPYITGTDIRTIHNR
ncbi:hypothetical protein DP145_01750 [Clostridium tetani]|uniref:phage neck terminator protein n=1 Tax=Clostridium tetani TaxID=1513 RepID=UPI00100C29E7|nr:hypothetical protein [Clostridium tetani]RXI46088.1 hypothetical protein DP126_07830 [Clostridium tetani]RXM61480.1 hypothetical protein DP138_04665 [Clostridium tetani]RXM70305.1 hypothetical protein DP145_01750 [Clostridium tetani]